MGHAVGDDRGLEGHDRSAVGQCIGDLVGNAQGIVHQVIVPHGATVRHRGRATETIEILIKRNGTSLIYDI
jgi:hypothetical protein